MKPGMMRAVIKPGEGPGVQLARVPTPTIGTTDVLIKVKAASICGSDIPIYDWDDPWTRATVQPGQIIGHEFCGEVIERGEQVDIVSVGDLVAVEGHLNCGACTQCRNGEGNVCPNVKLLGFERPGAFAEYIAVPARNVIPLSRLPLSVAAILDPFGCAVHSVTKVPLVNNTILITGCGPIGLMTITLAKILGTRRIFATEVSQYRLDLATKIGADLALNPHSDDVETIVKKETAIDSGVDVLFEMSGNPEAIKLGFKVLRPGGQAILLGLPKEPVLFDFANELVSKSITVHGIIGRNIYKTWVQVQKFLDPACSTKSINLMPIITHHFLIDDFEKAMDLVRSRRCGKVILYMEEESMLQNSI